MKIRDFFLKIRLRKTAEFSISDTGDLLILTCLLKSHVPAQLCPVFIEKKKHPCLYTVESHNLEVLGTRDFILNYRKFELWGGRHKNI